MSGTSSVGNSSVYEAGDQRNYKNSEESGPERYNEGVPNSHKPNDSSTVYSLLASCAPLMYLQRMSGALRTVWRTRRCVQGARGS